MEDKNIFHSILRLMCGKKYILMITDTAQIMSRQQQLEKSTTYGETYKKMSQSIFNHVASGGALGIALSLSMVRYFPSKFSTFGLNKVLVDMIILTSCLYMSTNMALKANYTEIQKIKKDFMINFDKPFLQHMAEIQIMYQIEEQDQVRGLFTQQQYKDWVSKRHLHMF